MMDLEQLYRLQVIDRRLQEVEAALEDQTQLKQLIAMKRREQDQGERLAVLEAKIERFREQILQGEDAIQNHEVKIAEYEKRLYDGTHRGAKELEHLETQVETVRQSRSEMERQILEVMEMVEQFDAEIHTIRVEYDDMVAQCQNVEQELKEYRQKLHTERKQLQGARNRVILTLPSDLYQHYLKVAAQHDGIAVSRVKQNRCSACQMTLSPGVLSRLRLSGEIEYCEFCGRILFCPPPDENKRKGLH